MPDSTNAGVVEAQGADAAQPHGGTSQAQGADAQQPDAGSADKESGTVDVAQLQRKLDELERDNAKYRSEARQREEAQRQADEAKLSDAERSAKQLTDLTAENADLKQRLTDFQTRSAVTAVAGRLGFIDPDDAYRLLDRSSLEYDESGAPKHVERLLNELLRVKPHLGNGTTRPAGSAEGGVRGSSSQGPNWFADAFKQRRGS